MLIAGTPVNRLTRYWKYAVFGTLVPGVALAIVAAPKLVWNDHPDPSWKMVGLLAGILCSIGGLMWLFFAIGTVGSDVAALWRRSKVVVVVLTFTAIALLAGALQRFTGPHFYGGTPMPGCFSLWRYFLDRTCCSESPLRSPVGAKTNSVPFSLHWLIAPHNL